MNTKRMFFAVLFAKKIFRGLIFTLALLLCNVQSFSTIVLDQQNTVAPTNIFVSLCAIQTFRPSFTGPFESVDLLINSTGTNNVTVELVTGNPASPGPILGSVVKPVNSGNAWIKFRFPSCGPVLNSGQEYFIRVQGSVDCFYSTGNPYGLGNLFQCTSTSYPTYDLGFKVFMYNGGCVSPIAGSNQAGVMANTASAPLGVNAGGEGGLWSSTGGGTFLNVTDPNTTYSPSCSDAGSVVTLTWTSCCNTSLICSQTISVVPPSLSVSSATVCLGQSANLNATGAVTYTWSANAGGATTNTVSVSPAITTTYTVTGTLSNGCAYPLIATVTVSNPPNATVSNNGPVCPGSPLSLTASPSGGVSPYTYSWTGPNAFSSTLQNPTVSASATPAMAGNYSLTIIGNNGCFAAPVATSVTIKPAPSASASNNGPVCPNTTLSLTGTPVGGTAPYTFFWSGPNAFSSTQQNPTVSPSATSAMAGNYTLTITGSNACSSPQAFTSVTVYNAVNGSLSTTNVSCFGGNNGSINVTPFGGSGPYTYSFNGGGFTPPTSYTSLSAGSYTVIIKDNLGCDSPPLVATINQPAALTGSLLSSSSVTCNGLSNGSATITQTGGTPTYQYSIDGGGSYLASSSFSGLAAGSYTVKVMDVNGCISNDVVFSITQPSPLSFSIGGNSAVCSGTALGITLSPSGGTAGYNFGWLTTDNTNTTGESTTNNTGSIINNNIINNTINNESLTYTVTLVDANSCSATNTVIATVFPKPSITSASSGAVCSGSPFSMNLLSNISSTYTWLTSDNASTTGESTTSQSSSTLAETISNPTAVNQTLVYTITPTATISTCVGNPQSFTLTVRPLPSISATAANNPICVGGSTVFNASGTNTYVWNPGTNLSSTTGSSVTYNAPISGTFNYTVTGTNTLTTCSNTTTLTINVNPVPAPPVPTSNSPVCTGSSLALSANTVGSATYSWTGPSAFTSSFEDPTPITATPSMAGTYSLTVTVAGCTSPVATTNVIINTTPTQPTPLSNSPVCSGGTLNLTTGLVAGATYNWTGPNSFVDAFQNPAITNVQLTANGTYSLSVTVNGCVSPTGTVSVVVNATPVTPSPSSTSPVCLGSVTSFTTASVVGASYNWAFGDGNTSTAQNPTHSYVAAGTYTASLIVTNSGCSSSPGSVVSVVNNTPVITSVASNSPICEGSTLNLTVTAVGATSYSWTGPNAFSSNVQNPSIAGALPGATGTYTVIASAGVCPSLPGNVSVVVNPTPPIPAPTSNSPVCLGSPVLLNTTTYGLATNYDWDFGDGSTHFNTATNVPASHLYSTAGTYTANVVISGVGGCLSSPGSVIVTVDDTPLAPVLGSNSPVCEGGNVNLTSTSPGATAFNWTGPNAFSTSTQNPTITGITPAGAGTYTATASIGVCTSPSSTIIITVNPSPTAPITGSNSPVCEGGTLSLSSTPSGGTSPYSFSWTGPGSYASIIQNPVVSTSSLPGMSGTYTLDVTDANGCSASATTNVTVNPRPVFTIVAPSTVCTNYNLNLTFTGLTGGSVFNYNWTGPNAFSSAFANPIRNNISTADGGNYSLQISNEFGCSFIDNFSVSVIPSPTADISGGPNVVCANEFAALSGSTSTANGGVVSGYQWLFGGVPVSGANLISFSANSPGNYFLEVVNSNGCVDTSLVYVLSNKAIPVPVITGNNSFCTGASSLLDASTSTPGGVSSLTSYQWLLNGAVISGATSVNYTAATGGNYELILSNSNGCTDTSVVFFLNEMLPPAPPVITSPTVSYCLNDSLLMSVQAPTGTHTYSWSINPAGLSVSSTSGTTSYIGGQSAGNYTVSVIETDLSGCSSNPGTSVITVNALPLASIIPPANTTICYNGSVAVGLNTVSGATSYDWTSSFGAVFNNIQNPTFSSIVQTGLVQLYGTVTDANGCKSLMDSVGIFVSNPLAAPTISSGGAICEGQSLSLFANPVISGASYLWTDPFSATQSGVDLNSVVIPSATVANSGPYTVSYTDANGCLSQTSAGFNETINPSPVINIVGTSSFCAGGSTVLSASTSVGVASAYQWYLNSSPIGGANTSSYSVVTGGDYTVEITLSSGCVGVSAVNTVVENVLPTVTINPLNSSICEGASTSLSASGASSYSWSNGGAAPTIIVSPLVGSTFIVVGTDLNGCSNSDTAFVIVNPKPVAPTASSSSSSECTGTAITLGSSSSFTNTWFNAVTSVALSNLQSFSHTESSSGAYSYGVYVTDANFCNSDTSYVNITFNNCLSVLNNEVELLLANGSATNNVFVNDGNPVGYTVNTIPVLSPFNGTFSINPTGSYTYTPNNGFSGYDIVVVSACNASAACLNDTIFISVRPHAVTDFGTVNSLAPNAQLTGNVLANDAGSGIAGSVVLTTGVNHGTLTISATGDFVYIPTPDYCGVDSFTYQITDVNSFIAYGFCIVDVSCDIQIITHTGFSPNNDGVNDGWVIANIDASPNRVTIYDRWGNEIWVGDNYNNTTIVWEGKNKNNEELSAGTYFYMIEVKDQKAVRGWVEITK